MDNRLENPAPIPADELKEIEQAIALGNWRKAKSAQYQGALAHEYHMSFDGYKTFETLRKAIAQYGFDGWFGKIKHRYLWVGEYKYWHYETVLNREHKATTLSRIAKDEERIAKKQAAEDEKERLRLEEEARKPKQNPLF